VHWIKIIEILQSIGVDWKYMRLIKNVYTQQSAFVKVGDWTSEACMIGTGVRKGCTFFPLLFNLYDEATIREATSTLTYG